jgi:RNA polymerase sigma factor (sigma-70 family)
LNQSDVVDSEEGYPDLIQRLRAGDVAAIEELYNLYFDRIYSMVFNQVGRNHTSAEEVVQEAWLAVVKSARKFKGQSQLYTWVCGIAWHKIRDFQRLHYREMARLAESSAPLHITELEVIDSEPLPQEVVERARHRRSAGDRTDREYHFQGPQLFH